MAANLPYQRQLRIVLSMARLALSLEMGGQDLTPLSACWGPGRTLILDIGWGLPPGDGEIGALAVLMTLLVFEKSEKSVFGTQFPLCGTTLAER